MHSVSKFLIPLVLVLASFVVGCGSKTNQVISSDAATTMTAAEQEAYDQQAASGDSQ